MKRRATIVLALIVASFAHATIWEGTASVGAVGAFPSGGSYAACNAFPLNTLIEIRNLENGRITKAIVTSGLDTPGIFLLLSPEAASALGIQVGNVARVRVSVSKSITELVPLGDGRSLSLDPDVNPSALARSSPSPVAVATPSPVAVATPSPVAVATPSPIIVEAPEQSSSRIGVRGAPFADEHGELEPDMPKLFSFLYDPKSGAAQSAQAIPAPTASPQPDKGQVLDGSFMSPRASESEIHDLALPGPRFQDTVAMLRLENPARLSYMLDALPEPSQDRDAAKAERVTDSPDVLQRTVPKAASSPRKLALAEPGTRIAEGLAESPYVYQVIAPSAEPPFTKLGMLEPTPFKDTVVDISASRGASPDSLLEASLAQPSARTESVEASQQIERSPEGREAASELAHEAEPFGAYVPLARVEDTGSTAEDTLVVLGVLAAPPRSAEHAMPDHFPIARSSSGEMPQEILTRGMLDQEVNEPWWAMDDPRELPEGIELAASDLEGSDQAEMIGLRPEESSRGQELAIEPSLPMEGGGSALAYEIASTDGPRESPIGEPSLEPDYERVISLAPTSERPPEASSESLALDEGGAAMSIEIEPSIVSVMKGGDSLLAAHDMPVEKGESESVALAVEPAFSDELPRSDEKVSVPGMVPEKGLDEKSLLAVAPKDPAAVEIRVAPDGKASSDSKPVSLDSKTDGAALAPKALRDVVSPWGTTFAEKLESGTHYIQIGSYMKEEGAVKAMLDFAALYPLSYQVSGERIRVYVGPLRPAESGVALYAIRGKGYKDAFIVKP